MPKANPITPSIGAIVLFHTTIFEQMSGDDPENPEIRALVTEVPAIVTRVLNPNCVNLTVFRDNGEPHPMVNVTYRPPGEQTHGWRWPSEA